jgi:aminoglycoside phosphotransferase (APT) family kinase protein
MNPFELLIQKFEPQSKLLRAWDLKGGVSAQVTALEIERPDGEIRKLVVRRHGERDRQRNPNIAAAEFKLLRQLKSKGLPVPASYWLETSGTTFPEPLIVLEFLEGSPDEAPHDPSEFLTQLAAQLAQIHRLDGLDPTIAFLPRVEDMVLTWLKNRPKLLDESLQEGKIRSVLEPVWPLRERNPAVLLHGDFWPGNFLWKNGQLVGVIDWEDAALGDPLFDLAISRLEILWSHGPEAMRQFTNFYQASSKIDETSLPYWDLCAALRPAGQLSQWCLDVEERKSLTEKHRWFVTQALDALSLSAEA